MSQGFWSLLKWMLLSFLILAYLSLRWRCQLRMQLQNHLPICFFHMLWFQKSPEEADKGMKSNLNMIFSSSSCSWCSPEKSHNLWKMMVGLDYNLSFKKNDPFFSSTSWFFSGAVGIWFPPTSNIFQPKNQGRMWQDKSRSKGEGKGSSPKASVRIAVISVPWVGWFETWRVHGPWKKAVLGAVLGGLY